MDRARPKISVVIPVRDGARFLAAAIESVISQDYPNREILVVDDGSTDGSDRIAASFADVVTFRQPPDGVAAARNRGIDESTGEILAFLDSDDLYVPGTLSRRMALLEENPTSGYILGRLENFVEPGLPPPSWFAAEAKMKDRLGFLTTGLFRRELFDSVGRFDRQFSIGEDIDWLMRARERGVTWVELPEVTLLRRVHDANTSADVKQGHAQLLKITHASLQRRRGHPAKAVPR